MMNNTPINISNFLNTTSNKYSDRITFTPTEISHMMGIPKYTIYQIIYSGELKAFKVGTHWVIHRQDLYAFIQQQIDNAIIL